MCDGAGASGREGARSLVVVLVEPKIEGNVGAVARCMANFGVRELVLVNPPALGDEAEKRAMHALDLLRSARVVGSFEEASALVDFAVGTSGIKTENDRKFVRLPETPEGARERLLSIDGRIGLFFGREDYGLRNEELERCDMLVTIPTHHDYPIMNLSHAVAVMLYELTTRGVEHKETSKASGEEKEVLFEHYAELLDEIEYPEFKREKMRVMFRRLIGRAAPSKWEYHSLMGVFSRTLKRLRRGRRE